LLAEDRKNDDFVERYTPAEADVLQQALLTSIASFEVQSEAIVTSKTLDSRDELDDIADDLVRTCSSSTNLVFVNARQRIELLADRLHKRTEEHGWEVDPFAVHHSSISKDLREDAEARLKSGIPTTVICSSTLELGIDIGSVRAVAQVDPPWSVSSALQRLGRSGRRDGEAAIMRVYSTDDPPAVTSAIAELIYPNLMRSLAIARLMFIEKWLEPVDLDQMHLSTLVHQILSCLRQTGGMNAAALFDMLIQKGPFRCVSKADFIELLRGLAKHAIVEQLPQGDLILAPEGEHITNRQDFYAAFSGTDELVVRHEQRQIGKIAADSVPPAGEHLLLAGRRWQVEEVDHKGKQVFVIPTKGRKSIHFASAAGEIHTRIITEIRKILIEEEEPPYLDDCGKQMLRTARTTAAKTGLLTHNLVRAEQSVEWFPWIGTRGQRALNIYARQFGIRCAPKGSLSILYETSYDDFCSYLEKVRTSDIDLAQLEDFRMEKYDDLVPEAL
jgi:ATP-dependent Lhr-like helicase